MGDQGNSPRAERWKGGYDDLEENDKEKSRDSSKHHSREKSKGSRKEEKDHRSRDRERSKIGNISKEREKESKDYDPGRERRKEDRDDYEKDRTRDKVREKDTDRDKHRDRERERDKDRKDRGKEKECEREREMEDSERERDKERGKEKRSDRDRERLKESDKARDRAREKEKEKIKDKEKEKENYVDKEREKVKERSREKERDVDQEKERSRERDKVSRKQQNDSHDRSKDLRKDDKLEVDAQYRDVTKSGVGVHDDDNETLKHEVDDDAETDGSQHSAFELQDRVMKMKEERLRKKSDGTSDVLSWVSKSRKLEEKRNAEKEKALQLSKIFEEQDKEILGEDEAEEGSQHASYDLAGVKVLHGLDKVIEGGAVVLTLKDQSILANGDINEEVDMLENVEIGEQKRRNEAYKAAKKKTGTYDDKFSEDPGSEKKMLPQYDDPIVEEGITLDANGRFGGDAEKKLEELRKRIDGVSTSTRFDDLNSSGKITSDYYTSEEMLQFKKPKKKKSLRKKDKLDIDALEAEAVSAGLGVGDLGSRTDGKRQAHREEQEKSEAERRSNAFQSAYAKANEASRALQMDQTVVQTEGEDNPVFGDDDDDLYNSLQRARKVALKKQDEGGPSGPQAIALRAASTVKSSDADNKNPVSGESQENKVVFTEMEEFVWGLQLDEEAHKPAAEDVFMEEDVVPRTSDQEEKSEDGGWAEVKDTEKDETMAEQDEEVVPDGTIHETAVGKGLSGALQLLKERGTLKETVEWGGRNMDKKKSKLVGIYENDGQKEIRIERTDEYGRILTPKEAFRLLSHKFHGKGPGKMKQEKRMRQYQEELKIKQMKNADTPSLSVERMREAQSKLKTPYLVLSGHVKPGQTSDPRSGFATVEKDFPGSLTPMLGDRKVEHFLGIKRNPESGEMPPPKKPRT